MKHFSSLRHLRWLSGLSLLVVQTAWGDSVTPEEPEAYAPFVIELEVETSASGFMFKYVLDIDVDAGEILIGFLNHGPDFIPTPTKVMEIELQGLPPGTYEVNAAFMPYLAEDNLEVQETGFSFTVADAPLTQGVHAFFHTGIEHYFITASDNEAEGLLAQNGWEIVDFGFNVWHADDPAPETAVPICRFYSALVNSHFYTGGANECAKLQEEDSGWTYEGIAFQALLPTKGACPAGTTPVWRLYNDRAAELDSNHRFVASSETYRAMIAEGWIGEGVAFCSPPAST